MIEEEKRWLDSAIPLDWGLTLYHDYAKYIVNIIYAHVFEKNSNKRKTVLIKIIANLRLAYDLGVPLRYSKSMHNYTNYYRNHKCGYKVVVSVINKLLQKDLIAQSAYFFNRGNSNQWNRQTRIWATRNFISLFEPIQPEDVIKEPPQLIQLRERLTKKEKSSGKISKQLDYSLTKDVLLMEKQLVDYHNLLEKNHISLEIPREVVFNLSQKSTEYLNETILKAHKFSVWAPEKTLSKSSDSEDKKRLENRSLEIGYRYSSIGYKYSSIGYRYSSIHTNTSNLFVTLRYNWVLRVFSETFNLGGRYYGSGWNEMSSELRNYLKINFESVCEPDYQGQHLRILYHLNNMDYDGDVYDCGNAPRELYKVATLVLLNSKSNNHYQAVRYAFRKKKLHIDKYPNCLYKDYIMPIINDIFKTHNKISKHFFSDMGIKLQNIDSRITSNILNYFIGKDIVILPVHDSYIIQNRYKKELIQVMSNEYEKIMKFKPIIT